MNGDISAVHVTPLIDLNAIQSLLKYYLFPQEIPKLVIEYINTLLKRYPNEYLEKSTLLTGEKYETMA